MIILIDNKNYMIRYCQDEPHIHGFDVSYPNWKGLMKLLSDIGETVVVSGEEAEQYLDENHIYYIHVEHKAKESFETFVKRLNRLVKENQEFIDANLSSCKLLFGIAKEGEKATVNTDNVFAIWKDLETEDYFMEINVEEDINPSTLKLLLDHFADEARAWYGNHPEKATTLDLSELLTEDVSVVYGNTIEDLLLKLEFMAYVVEAVYLS